MIPNSKAELNAHKFNILIINLLCDFNVSSNAQVRISKVIKYEEILPLCTNFLVKCSQFLTFTWTLYFFSDLNILKEAI
jgi:hypothetical protein